MYLCQTELFEIEPIICIKMDLALNNLQRLICHKTQTTTTTEQNFEETLKIIQNTFLTGPVSWGCGIH